MAAILIQDLLLMLLSITLAVLLNSHVPDVGRKAHVWTIRGGFTGEIVPMIRIAGSQCRRFSVLRLFVVSMMEVDMRRIIMIAIWWNIEILMMVNLCLRVGVLIDLRMVGVNVKLI